MGKLIFTLALIASSMACAERIEHHSGSPAMARGISAQEREALVALYNSTDGDHWKNHDGWLGPVGNECSWNGVLCEFSISEPATVRRLELESNNLNGPIPETFGQLVHPQTLMIRGNHLSGRLPEHLIQLWLAGTLSVTAEAPLLTSVSQIDFEFDASSLLCGRHRIVLGSDETAVLYTERCRKASPNDRTTFCEVKTGHIWDEEFAMLAWLIEKNRFYALQHEYNGGAIDASPFDSIRVTRDGKPHEVVAFGGGTFELWAIITGIDGVSSAGVRWDATKTIPECPRWDGSKSPPKH